MFYVLQEQWFIPNWSCVYEAMETLEGLLLKSQGTFFFLRRHSLIIKECEIPAYCEKASTQLTHSFPLRRAEKRNLKNGPKSDLGSFIRSFV